jgi:hypothetical protein
VNRSIGKSPFEIVYGIQPRGITELRNLIKMSSEVLEQRILQQKCRNSMKESESSYRTTIRNTRADLIKREEKFNSKLGMKF